MEPYDSALLTSNNISKIPSLCWKFADFREHEQDGGHSNHYFIGHEHNPILVSTICPVRPDHCPIRSDPYRIGYDRYPLGPDLYSIAYGTGITFKYVLLE